MRPGRGELNAARGTQCGPGGTQRGRGGSVRPGGAHSCRWSRTGARSPSALPPSPQPRRPRSRPARTCSRAGRRSSPLSPPRLVCSAAPHRHSLSVTPPFTHTHRYLPGSPGPTSHCACEIRGPSTSTPLRGKGRGFGLAR